MPIASSREAGSVLRLISWVCITYFNLLERHKATLEVNWKGGFFVICCWDIPQYGGWQNWNLFQIKVSSFSQLERSNKQRMWLQRQQKGWFLRDACPVISVGIVSSSHSTYLKNIKPFKRAQAAFWSYCWCIFFSLYFPQPGERDPLTPSCWSRQSIKPSKPVWDQQGIWHKVCPLTAPAPALLKRPLQKALEERRTPHAGACSAELWRFISDHSLCITGAAPRAFGLLTNPIQ